MLGGALKEFKISDEMISVTNKSSIYMFYQMAIIIIKPIFIMFIYIKPFIYSQMYKVDNRVTKINCALVFWQNQLANRS